MVIYNLVIKSYVILPTPPLLITALEVPAKQLDKRKMAKLSFSADGLFVYL